MLRFRAKRRGLMRREYAEAITVAVLHICLCYVQSYRWNTEKHVDRPTASSVCVRRNRFIQRRMSPADYSHTVCRDYGEF